MYLEISARQTGKTSRLFDFAYTKVRKGDSVLVVHPYDISGIIVNNWMTKDRLIAAGVKFIKGDPTVIDYQSFDWVCYDEFDCNRFLTPKLIQNNCYFTTSPISIRKIEERTKQNNTDLLYNLILKKKGKYTCFWSTKTISNPDLPVNEKFACWSSDKVGIPILPLHIKYISF